MTVRIFGTMLAMVLGTSLGQVDAAPRRPTMAIMPTQYFSADLVSATNITRSLTLEYRRQGYRVPQMTPSRTTFDAMRLSRHRPYGDRVAVRFGRRLGVDLVAYPQLLAMGAPAYAPGKTDGTLRSGAVLHLRVVNTHTGRRIYSRQIRREVDFPPPSGAIGPIPPPATDEVVLEATQPYFERVAGRRQEYRRR